MESGGSHSLMSSGNSCDDLPLLSQANQQSSNNKANKVFQFYVIQTISVLKLLSCYFHNNQRLTLWRIHDYMVKPHVQLVLVSSTLHSAYTSSLSTSSSSTALQEDQVLREI